METGASFFYKRANPNGFERFPKLPADYRRVNPNGFMETGASFFYKRANPNGFERFPKLPADRKFFTNYCQQNLLNESKHVKKVLITDLSKKL